MILPSQYKLIRIVLLPLSLPIEYIPNADPPFPLHYLHTLNLRSPLKSKDPVVVALHKYPPQYKHAPHSTSPISAMTTFCLGDLKLYYPRAKKEHTLHIFGIVMGHAILSIYQLSNISPPF